jgi:hypothetical protein
MADFSPSTDPPAASRAQFFARVPSANWEQIPLRGAGGFLWVWFKPPAVPNGFIIRIPDEVFAASQEQAEAALPGLTMRHLLGEIGIDLTIVSLWYQYGVPCEGRTGASPSLDQTIPPPPAGADPQIVVLIAVPAAGLPFGQPPNPDVASVTSLTKVFDEMEADWYAVLLLEKQLLLARKQLTNALGRLAALDRDLSPEERLHGDRQDKSDWQEVRRSLKDAATKLSRFVKEHDVGETSAAGKKHWFSEVYQKFVVPRQAFDGLVPLHREFESYRKRLQILLQNMQLSNTNVAQESERKAQQILFRIGSRARSAQHKTTGWTAHRWLTHKQRDRM